MYQNDALPPSSSLTLTSEPSSAAASLVTTTRGLAFRVSGFGFRFYRMGRSRVPGLSFMQTSSKATWLTVSLTSTFRVEGLVFMS